MSLRNKRFSYDNVTIESFNGIINTKSFYSELGKTTVNGIRISRADIVRKAEGFITYYNNIR